MMDRKRAAAAMLLLLLDEEEEDEERRRKRLCVLDEHFENGRDKRVVEPGISALASGCFSRSSSDGCFVAVLFAVAGVGSGNGLRPLYVLHEPPNRFADWRRRPETFRS